MEYFYTVLFLLLAKWKILHTSSTTAYTSLRVYFEFKKGGMQYTLSESIHPKNIFSFWKCNYMKIK